MRRKDTPTALFRSLLREISLLMGYEITRQLPVGEQTIRTPLVSMQAPVLDGRKPVIVPILRAGLGMADGLTELIPSARVGHIGLVRDPETRQPVEYFVKLPNMDGRLVIVCDPLLATGNSAVHAVRVLLDHSVEMQNIRFLSLLAAPEGLATFFGQYPHVPVYTAAIDTKLNDEAYILPGLGDAGDRLYGTK